MKRDMANFVRRYLTCHQGKAPRPMRSVICQRGSMPIQVQVSIVSDRDNRRLRNELTPLVKVSRHTTVIKR